MAKAEAAATVAEPADEGAVARATMWSGLEFAPSAPTEEQLRVLTGEEIGGVSPYSELES